MPENKESADRIDPRIYGRYDEAAAKLAWKRTIAHFKKHPGQER